LAQNIVAGHGYVISRFGHLAYAFGDGNLYSFLAATVYLIVGVKPQVLAVVQAVLVSLAAPVIFVIGERAFGSSRAAVGAAMAALHPGLLAYTLKLHPLGLDVLLMALTVLWVRRTGERWQDSLLSGVALGVSLMSRPTFFLAGLAASAVHWLGRPRRLGQMLVPVVVALVIATPWVVRNWTILGRPVFISTSLEDVWKGNNPAASGSSYLADGRDVFAAAPPEVQARFQQAGELELNDVFGREVLAFVIAQPREAAGLVVRKFFYFWWLSPQAGLFYPASWLSAYAAYAAVILIFAAIGALAIVRGGSGQERRLLSVLAAINLTIALLHSLAYVEGRHRWGIEPLLLLLTARGIFSAATALHGLLDSGHWRGLRHQIER
jgi:hypothetical protein